MNCGDTFTVEAWIKLTTLSANHPIVVKGVNNAYRFYILSTGALALYKGPGTLSVTTATGLITSGSTFHCVATKSGATNKIYVNGVDVTGSVTNQTMVDNAEALFWGWDGGTTWLDGVADEIAVYSTALSSVRVAAHYAARTR